MIGVLVADDHALVRRGLRQLLEPVADVKIVGEVETGAQVPDAVARLRPDVLMLDVSMPDTNFLQLLKILGSQVPRLRTLVVSAHAEELYARRAIRAGAAGYITKGREDAELITAIRTVARGDRYISPELAQDLAADLATGDYNTSHHKLSDREQEIMLLLASGHTATAIAEQLNLSVKTISTHRTRLLRKLQLSSNADLVRYALAHGLIT